MPVVVLVSEAVIALLAVYWLLRSMQPYARCRKCSGTGIRAVRSGRVKACRSCRGKQYRPRAGRRPANRHGRVR